MRTIATVQGLGMVIGLMGFLWWRHGERWRRFAAAYPAQELGVVRETRRMQTVIVRSPSGIFHAYQGTVTVTIAALGVSLRLMPPWSAFHPEIFLPAAEVVAERTGWYLNATSYAVTLPRVPGLDLLVTGDDLDWFSSVSHRGPL